MKMLPQNIRPSAGIFSIVSIVFLWKSEKIGDGRPSLSFPKSGWTVRLNSSSSNVIPLMSSKVFMSPTWPACKKACQRVQNESWSLKMTSSLMDLMPIVSDRCTRFLSAHPEWKVLLLGALIRSSRKTEEPAVQKVRYQSLAHAYALNRPYAETLAYKPWGGEVVDILFRPLSDHIYAVYPMFAFQGDSTTDNKYLGLARFRRWCGGLETIQKGNEFYQRHKVGIIALHVLILFFLFVFFLSR